MGDGRQACHREMGEICGQLSLRWSVTTSHTIIPVSHVSVVTSRVIVEPVVAILEESQVSNVLGPPVKRKLHSPESISSTLQK